TLPEKKMVFKGLVTNKEDMNKLMLTPLIRYPLPGGSALITFEEAKVAQRIIAAKEHVVELSYGEELEELDRCRVQVQAAPVELLLPSALEVGLSYPPPGAGMVQVSGAGQCQPGCLCQGCSLPRGSAGAWGGSGLPSPSAVAEPLIARGRIQVLIGKGKYELKISPCMSGDITSLQLQPCYCCPRTVLLSGIPPVLGQESMRDTLEIHFQKASRGGGEVDALAYVPAGRWGVAVFTEDVALP
ncbi:IN35 protein, partial [Stercorarius parasiticus]|nr:IN35 protein [Stercorarius parasiticus]